MAKVIHLKKGLDIKLKGAPLEIIGKAAQSELIGLVPDHFAGLVPKPVAKPGDKLKVGSVLFVDKNCPDLRIVSPVSGELVAINRGERRKIVDIIIKNDFKMEQEAIPSLDVQVASKQEVKQLLLAVGLFSFIKQRPYDIIANPNDTPKAIFISTFDTAPLAPDYNFILKDQLSDFQAGITALSKLATVCVGVKAGNSLFDGLKNAELTYFKGAHPVGNVGVQINNINPVNKGEVVWTINPQEVLFIGRYANKGKLDFSKLIASTGSEVTTPAYYPSIVGAPITPIVKANVSQGVSLRYISGNVLSGEKIGENSFINPFHSQISVIPEGDDNHELLGWIMPRFNMFSNSGTYLTKLMQFLQPKKAFEADARVLGGERHMIMSGEYDNVLPMDIYPEFLIKAIIAKDIDKMEALGIYEIAPEDVALCEFVCSSKMQLQKIVREGLELLRKEMN
jgi:Na+-transporting NADH:ubiquinone oxidoreductase subunit A